MEVPAPSPVTIAGTGRLRIVPSPSCPAVLAPQQRIAPLWRIAQVCCAPVATATGSVNVGTRTGRGCDAPPALPSWPVLLAPQQKSPEARVAAQVWLTPVATWVTPVSGCTRAG